MEGVFSVPRLRGGGSAGQGRVGEGRVHGGGHWPRPSSVQLETEQFGPTCRAASPGMRSNLPGGLG